MIFASETGMFTGVFWKKPSWVYNAIIFDGILIACSSIGIMALEYNNIIPIFSTPILLCPYDAPFAKYAYSSIMLGFGLSTIYWQHI